MVGGAGLKRGRWETKLEVPKYDVAEDMKPELSVCSGDLFLHSAPGWFVCL